MPRAPTWKRAAKRYRAAGLQLHQDLLDAVGYAQQKTDESSALRQVLNALAITSTNYVQAGTVYMNALTSATSRDRRGQIAKVTDRAWADLRKSIEPFQKALTLTRQVLRETSNERDPTTARSQGADEDGTGRVGRGDEADGESGGAGAPVVLSHGDEAGRGTDAGGPHDPAPAGV